VGGVTPAQEKERELDRILSEMGSLVVAFSGGVDSSYLAVRAHRVLGIRALAVTADSESLADGLIVDDLSDFRPGQRAAAEAGVRSPLAEAGLFKAEIRELSHGMGLPTWDQPSSPCLSSRVAYGLAVTDGVLRQVERAEQALGALGFREFRVRHLGASARVEIAPGELSRLAAESGLRQQVEQAVKSAGYGEVHIDREGYRRGRLNEALRVVSPA
jgi:pyridinium-3,5-biscarboxylic acid mononucleotide sulfurtransferase